MEDLITFCIAFILIFTTYLIIYFIKMKKKNLAQMTEVILLKKFFDLKDVKLKYKLLCFFIILINSIIISIAGTICTMIKMNYIWQILIGFVILVSLIYLFYNLLGIILKKKYAKEIKEIKKGKEKDEHTRNRKKVAKKVGRK